MWPRKPSSEGEMTEEAWENSSGDKIMEYRGLMFLRGLHALKGVHLNYNI
jgi:hypothetical protein